MILTFGGRYLANAIHEFTFELVCHIEICCSTITANEQLRLRARLIGNQLSQSRERIVFRIAPNELF